MNLETCVDFLAIWSLPDELAFLKKKSQIKKWDVPSPLLLIVLLTNRGLFLCKALTCILSGDGAVDIAGEEGVLGRLCGDGERMGDWDGTEREVEGDGSDDTNCLGDT